MPTPYNAIVRVYQQINKKNSCEKSRFPCADIIGGKSDEELKKVLLAILINNPKIKAVFY